MKKVVKLICVSIVLILTFASCSFAKNSDDNSTAVNEKSYKGVVDEFLEAVDKKDKTAIKEMFSVYVQEKDKDLDKQINRLLKVYPGPTTQWYYDEMLAGEFTSEYKSKESAESNVFPVLCQGKYYWCSLQWVRSNEKNPDKEGIKEVSFFTAEDYYVFCEEFGEYENKTGLAVYADEKLDFPICCIGGQPYKYNTKSRLINRSEAEGVLRMSRKFSDFKKRFGKPRAEYTTINCFYEMFEENNEKRYLALTIDEDTDEIIKAEVMNSFSVVDTFIDNTKRETQSTQVQNNVQ